MKKFKLFSLLIVMVGLSMPVLTGCQTSIYARKFAETPLPLLTPVKDSAGNVVSITNGYTMASGGYEMHARSPLWATESLDGLKLDVGEGANHVGLGLDKYRRDLSTNAVAMVGGIETAVCDVVGKVAAAYVNAQTGGASAAASSLGSLTLSAIASKAQSLLSTGTNTTQQAADSIICNGADCAKGTDGDCSK